VSPPPSFGQLPLSSLAGRVHALSLLVLPRPLTRPRTGVWGKDKRRNVKRFRGGLVDVKETFISLNSRLGSNKEEEAKTR
jgi:hypothetical protein